MDTDLVIRAQHGDEGAFASLAVACGDRLHAVAHRILRDVELAESPSWTRSSARCGRPVGSRDGGERSLAAARRA